VRASWRKASGDASRAKRQGDRLWASRTMPIGRELSAGLMSLRGFPFDFVPSGVKHLFDGPKLDRANGAII